MCGFAGILRLDGAPVDRAALLRMAAAVAHRGPDGRGLLLDGPLGMAHHRLAIRRPGPEGDQPMRGAGGATALVWNGEITNEADLRAHRERAGRPPVGPSDTALLLALLTEEGAEALPRLDGMFALAFLDRAAGTLLLARDRSGIKPLYYTRRDDALLFASEIKALLADPATPRRLDADLLPHYLAFQSSPPDRTLFRGIDRLPPATRLTVRTNGPAPARPVAYWNEPAEEPSWDYAETVARTRAAVTSSIRAHADEPLPVAALLSGGLDSSVVTLVAAAARREAGEPLHTYSSVFPGFPMPDEASWSHLVAAAAGSEHRPVTLDRDEMRAMHHEILRLLDYPEAGPAVPYLAIQKVVAARHKVVLTGLGGDELYGGYPKYLAGGLGLGLLPPTDPAWHAGFESQFRSIVQAASAGQDAALVKIYSRARPLVDHLAPPFAERARAFDAAAFLRSLLPGGEVRSVADLLRIDRRLLLPALLHVEDRVSMAHGLESRPPLLGNGPLEVACRMPAAHLFRSGLKGVLRDAFRDLLPEPVYARNDKCGLLYPIFLDYGDASRDFLADAYAALDAARIFDTPCAELAARYDLSANRRIAWGLFSLGAWIRAFAPAV